MLNFAQLQRSISEKKANLKNVWYVGLCGGGPFASYDYLARYIYRDFRHWKCFLKMVAMATCPELFTKVWHQNLYN